MDIQLETIRRYLETIGCPLETFLKVAEFPSARWSRVTRGVVSISGDEILKLSGIALALRQIAEAAKPLPLSFRSVEDVKLLLEYHRCLVLWKTIPSVLDEDFEQQN